MVMEVQRSALTKDFSKVIALSKSIHEISYEMNMVSIKEKTEKQLKI